jgi:glutathione S-transferase
MPLMFFGHPFASYCQKALIAIYENGTPFTFRVLDKSDPSTFAEFAALWPLKHFPLLVDERRAIAEATIIIEYLGMRHPGPVRLIPDDPTEALEVRFVDRFFDNYVLTPQGKIVTDALREACERDLKGVADARVMLDTAYRWLENAWQSARGRSAIASLRIARQRPLCSTQTGRIRSANPSRTFARTAAVSTRECPLLARSRKHGPTALFFRLERLIATDARRCPMRATRLGRANR